MFIGHFAAGFAAKAAMPKTNLGWLLTAGALVDVVFTVLVLSGVEHARIVPGLTEVNALDLYDYAWSHSLVAVIGWSALATLAWWTWRRSWREALIIGAVVLSHWILDVVSHIPDVPLWPGSTTLLGLGLWRSMTATVLVEGALWVAGLSLYLRTTEARDRHGRWSFWAFVTVVSAIYVLSLVSPPPPDFGAVAWGNLAMAVFLLWAAWFDGHRAPRAVDRS